MANRFITVHTQITKNPITGEVWTDNIAVALAVDKIVSVQNVVGGAQIKTLDADVYYVTETSQQILLIRYIKRDGKESGGFRVMEEYSENE